jgi:hypothetical protein
VKDSMSREDARRYAAAFHYAVIERDLTFAFGDQFADWWTTSGWMFHRTMADGFANWAAGVFPRAVDDEE